MALPFIGGQSKKRDQIIAIDLGSRTTKAVYLQRKGGVFNFLNFTLQEAPTYEKGFSEEVLSEHLKKVTQPLGARTKAVILVLGVNDSLLRPAELPLVPVSDLRMMLKFNSRNYLQQDLPDYVFDVYLLPPSPGSKMEPGKTQKSKALVGGAKKQVIDTLANATKAAGFTADQIAPSLIGPVNAFEMAHPDIFAKEVVALVDIGFKNSSITILLNGEMVLSRVVGIGADKLTSGLADALNVTYAEAEGIKVGLPDEVQGTMQSLLAPLGQELRASMNFFEHQHDKTVSQVFLSGGSARSAYVVETLQSELMVACKSWNPSSFMNLSLPPQQIGEVEQVAPQLAVAVGAAMAAF